jgi:hypothetical protein
LGRVRITTASTNKALPLHVPVLDFDRPSPLGVPQTQFSLSSARTTKRFPSSRCASAIQIVRPLESIAKTRENGGFGTLDTANPARVRTIDLSNWLRQNTRIFDYVILKLDVEGAEYNILEKMIRDRTIRRINHLFIEWHWDRVGVPHDRHLRLVRAPGASTPAYFGVGCAGLLRLHARAWRCASMSIVISKPPHCPAALLVVVDHLRRTFARFKRGAHFLEARSESFNLLLRFRYDRSLFFHFAVLFDELIEQHCIHRTVSTSPLSSGVTRSGPEHDGVPPRRGKIGERRRPQVTGPF